LPVSLTPFIGREQELAELGRLMAEPECRCLTLVGPGGIGKTRLAVQTADQHRNEFAHGIAFIPLASVGAVDAVIPAIASAINLAFYGPIDPKVQLLNYLREKQMLLVVDNVEHLLVEGAHPGTIAELLIEILRGAAAIKLLVTSREVLNLQGEWSLEVQGLAFPRVEQVDRFDEYSAVALFVQRARRARPGFEMNAEDKAGVVRLCRLVEGMPLAIELAATWVRILSPPEIASEVEHNLDFLNAQMRDLPERHRSMRAVFDHSWQMLSTEEKRVLGRLSVFRGGFQRQAAEQVVGASLSVLSSLVIRSLLRRTAAGRYDLHELIRQYSASKLAEDPPELHAVQERHSVYYLGLLEEEGLKLRTDR
jgi:predicted ATPase